MNSELPVDKCLACQHTLAPDFLDGLCPVCVLKQVLFVDSNSIEDLQADASTDWSASERVTLGDSKQESDTWSGRRFFGDYELHELIARGGMGVVYRATQMSLSRSVALKMIRTGKLSSDLDIERLRREAMAAGQLNHPGIVPVIEFSEHDGLHYFSMPFIEGQSLAQRLNEGPLPLREAAELIKKVAVAIAYAHSKGVVHRDIKPGNIMLGLDGQPHVSDFGLAKQLTHSSELTASGEVLGTPAFMPPEQAKGRIVEVGPLADIYSIGAVLYATLTGRPPFQAPTSVETLRLVIDNQPIAPRLLNPQVPRDLETICLKCLDKDPNRRYATAEGIANDLDRWLSGAPILARPISRYRKAVHWCQVHRVASILAALITLMIGVVTGVLVLSNQRLQKQLSKTITAETAARQASNRAQDLLWISYLSEANAKVHSQQSGQRLGALEAIKKARELPIPVGHSMDELRTEATAALGLPDMREALVFHAPDLVDDVSIDRHHQLFGFYDSGQYVVRDIHSTSPIAKLQLPKAKWIYNYEGPVFSPDSQLFVYPKMVENQARLHLWKLDEQRSVYDMGDALHVAFRQDGQYCATTNADGTISIIDCRRFVEHSRFKTSMNLPWLAWSPANDQIAVIAQTDWQVIDAFSGQVVLQIAAPQGLQGWPAWHPSGEQIAIGSPDMRVRIWDLESGQLVMEPLEGLRRGGIILRFSPTGNYLLGNDWGHTARLWELASGQQRLAHAMRGVRLEFSEDGRTLAADCSPKRVRILDYVESRTVRTVWEKPGKSSSFSVVHSSPCIDPTGRLLALRTDEGLCLIDVEHGKVVASVSLSGSGPLRFHQTADGQLSLWSHGKTGFLNWPIAIDWPANQLTIGPPERMATIAQQHHWGSESAGLSVLIPTSEGGLLWDVERSTSRLLRHPPDVRFCAMNKAGTLGVTGSHSIEPPGAIAWNCLTGEKIAELTSAATKRAVFSDDDRWLITHSNQVQLWKVGEWDKPRELDSQFDWSCFSFDSRLLAVSSGVSQIKLLDPETCREVAVLSAAEPEILYPMLFSPDGTKLFALTNETLALKIFDLAILREQLSSLDLDWDFPPLVASPANSPHASPLKATTHLGNIDAWMQAIALERAATRLSLSGQPAEAIEKLRESIRLYPEHADAHNDLAWILCTGPEQLRSPAEAVAVARVAVQCAPYQAAHHNTLGVAQFQSEQYEAAIESLNRSVELSGHLDSYDAFHLAMCYWYLNQPERATEKLAEGIAWMESHAPNDPELQPMREQAERLLNNHP